MDSIDEILNLISMISTIDAITCTKTQEAVDLYTTKVMIKNIICESTLLQYNNGYDLGQQR